MKARNKIAEVLQKVVKEISGQDIEVVLQPSEKSVNGDYYTNISMRLSSTLKKKPLDVAYEIKKAFDREIASSFGNEILGSSIEKVEVAPPGFVNFYLTQKYLVETAEVVNKKGEKFGNSESLKEQKIMIEYAHPNTHKEMHIGHMRTLITGEALARLFESQGATVFRANYQGDIGPHVAKALYGIQKIMAEEKLTIEKIDQWSNIEKAHFLGRGYVRGNQDYETHKKEIDDLNTSLYARDKKIWPLYEATRQWNLDYYEDFYKRFYTKYDKLFFESDMDTIGKKKVAENIGKIFEENDGAVIFPGEKYGLHTRVFITSAGNPTYEGKEMGNAYAEYEAFPFDRKIHVVASEQTGYFKVVFKALDLMDPEKFENKQLHVSMGMVQLSDRKMSSRTGDILTVDWLIDEVKERVRRTIEKAKISKELPEDVLEAVTIGAIKYSVLKTGTGQDVAFNIEQSVSLDGDSGPYIQYTYVRTKSVLEKSKKTSQRSSKTSAEKKLNSEESEVLRQIVYFPEIVMSAQEKMAPNLVAEYLFDLSKEFNYFYQKHKIAEDEFRLSLTQATGQVIKNGLDILGIKTVDKM